MSGITQIVGQSSGVSSLLAVDSTGQLLSKDAASITQITGVNTKLTAIDTVLDNSLVKLAAIETLNTAGNASTAAMVVDLAAIEILNTAGNASTAAMVVDLAAIEIKQTAIASALAGTLAVSSPTLSTTNSLLRDNVSVAADATSTTSSVDLGGVRRCAIFGGLGDNSANLKIQVSADDSNFFDNTEQTVYITGGEYYKSIDLDARYIRVSYTNESGSAKDWTLNLSRKA